MAPKRRGGCAAPKAKRGRAGDSQHLEADAGATSEPPLAVANHPQRLVQFHRSEDGKVFVELTTLWRWLAGNIKNTKGEIRLAKTLRRRGYNGASFTAPTDGPGAVRHVELRVTKCPKTYPVADGEALKDLVQELNQDVIDANEDLIGKVFQRMGAEPGQLVTHYPQVAFIENGDKLAVVKRPGYKPRVALFALLKIFAPRYDPWYLFYKTGLRELLIACGVRQPSSSTQAQDGADDEGAGGVRQPSSATPLRKGADDEGAGEGPRRILFDAQNLVPYQG